MRHNRAGLKLNRTSSHRDAMFRNMVTSLLKYDCIRTTSVRAKELQRVADHVIGLAKRGDLHALRQVMAIVREKPVVHKLFAEAQNRYGNISGGYTLLARIGHRLGDAAPMSMIELVAREQSTPLQPRSRVQALGKGKKAATPAVETPTDKGADPQVKAE